jgi:hypothetical protein
MRHFPTYKKVWKLPLFCAFSIDNGRTWQDPGGDGEISFSEFYLWWKRQVCAHAFCIQRIDATMSYLSAYMYARRRAEAAAAAAAEVAGFQWQHLVASGRN